VEEYDENSELPFEWNSHVADQIQNDSVTRSASDITVLLGDDPAQPSVNTSILTAQTDSDAAEILEWMRQVSDEEEERDDADVQEMEPLQRRTSEAQDIVYDH